MGPGDCFFRSEFVLKLKLIDYKKIACFIVALVLVILPLQGATADTAYNTLTYSNVMSFDVSRSSAGVVPVYSNGRTYLYGTLVNSSQSSGGAIYRTSSDGSVVQTLYQLQNTDGYVPQGGLVLGQDNNLYGTTVYGPRVGLITQAGSGTVFRISLDGTGYTTLHTFDALTAEVDAQTALVFGINNDGASPAQALTDGGDGFLYGVASSGGLNGTGTVFRMQLDGSNFQVIHSFAAINRLTLSNTNYTHEGAFPAGALAFDSSSGYLYGVTGEGGDVGNGTLYRLRADGTEFQTLFSFEPLNGTVSGLTGDSTNCHGANPNGRPLLANGFLYGVTTNGGNDSANCDGEATGAFQGFGTVFAVALTDMPPSGLVDYSKFQTVHDFDGGTGESPVGGQSPIGDLLLSSDGVLIYGETSGSNGSTPEAIFSIDTRSPSTGFNLAHSFGAGEGSGLTGHLIQANDGYLYGTATSGGACSGGAVFQLRSDGSPQQTGDVSCINAYTPSNSNQNSLYGGGKIDITLVCLLCGLLGMSLLRNRFYKSGR